MSKSIFSEREHKPDSELLSKVLGESHPLWQEIKEHLNQTFGEIVEEWKYYGLKSGWVLKMLKKKRNLFFFIPMQSFFVISFVFGNKAVNQILETDFPDEIKAAIRNARKYAEGRGLPIEVRSENEVEQVKTLVEIKVNN
ncbi:MAG: DUF3788 domain-containing protein [Calditrichia bacterium]|nr:DUF3788 domain-containing protein [Calditrichia bacterium]